MTTSGKKTPMSISLRPVDNLKTLETLVNLARSSHAPDNADIQITGGLFGIGSKVKVIWTNE